MKNNTISGAAFKPRRCSLYGLEKKLLMTVGSLRKKSFNRQLAGKVEEMLKEQV